MNAQTLYTLNKEEVLVLLIDVQEKLLPVMKEPDDLLKQLKILLEGAKVLGLPLIATEQYPKGVGHTAAALQSYVQSCPLLEKNTFTAWSPELQKLLNYYDVKQIIVAGIEAHICVFQTVRDLLSAGYSVFLLQDAVSSRTRENKGNALVQIKDMGAVITNVETVLFDLLHQSGTPEFKAISALIK